MHASPARAWTLEGLAHEVGISRSALAERFTEFVGQPPMQYLANWRMQLAANHLMTGTDNVAEVAERVGYESEAAFSRAFKKAVGVPPGQWRKHRAGVPVSREPRSSLPELLPRFEHRCGQLVRHQTDARHESHEPSISAIRFCRFTAAGPSTRLVLPNCAPTSCATSRSSSADAISRISSSR